MRIHVQIYICIFEYLCGVTPPTLTHTYKHMYVYVCMFYTNIYVGVVYTPLRKVKIRKCQPTTTDSAQNQKFPGKKFKRGIPNRSRTFPTSIQETQHTRTNPSAQAFCMIEGLDPKHL